MQRTLTPVALRHYTLPVNNAPMNVSGAWNEPAATNGDAHTVYIGSHDDRSGNLDDVNVGAASPSRRKRSIQRGLWLWWRTVAESISHCRGACRACGVPRRRTIKRRLSLSLSSFTRSTVAMGSSSRSFSRRLSLPVAAVILLFVSVYVSIMRCTLLRWQGATPGQLALGACALTLSATYALSCYVLAVVTDPGRVPYQWAPCDYGGGGAPGEGEEVKRKGSNQRRFCSKCHAFKPPRSHHCRRCQRCVLRMDHHCVWLNTCVGHCNYKVFILFISSTTAILFGIVAAIAFHLRAIAMSIASSRDVMGTRDERTGIVRMAMDVGDPFRLAQRFALAGTTRQCVVTELGVGLLSFCLAMAIGALLLYHVYLFCNNMTTIEYYEGVRTAKRSSSAQAEDERAPSASSSSSSRSPYNLGLLENLRQTFGADARLWLVPWVITGHCGTSFPTQSNVLKRQVTQRALQPL